MPRSRYNVLFLCTGNSARSIIAELLMNAIGDPRFRAYSAGSHPSGAVNPLVLAYLNDQGVSTAGARSKSWDEFADAGAPDMDFVITVCDQAAGEACPLWPGRPLTAHWSVTDPAAYMHDPVKARQIIEGAFATLRGRIQRFLALPVEELDRATLEDKLRSIGDPA